MYCPLINRPIIICAPQKIALLLRARTKNFSYEKNTNGGPANTTITMSHYIYNNSFGQGVANFGYASAMSFFVFILVAILAAINLKVGDTRD